MAINFNEETLREFLEKLSSYQGSVTNYCKEKGMTKSQLYYKKKFNKKSNPTFHVIEVKHEPAGAF